MLKFLRTEKGTNGHMDKQKLYSPDLLMQGIKINQFRK